MRLALGNVVNDNWYLNPIIRESNRKEYQRIRQRNRDLDN
jgi:hypothetical protein